MMPEPITERLLNEDIDTLSLAVEKSCALIDRLRTEKAELLAVLKYALSEESGFACPATTENYMTAAIAKCEATS